MPQSPFIPSFSELVRSFRALIDALNAEREGPTPDVSITLLRPDDLLHAHVLGYNLQLDPFGEPEKPRLVRAYLSPMQAAPSYGTRGWRGARPLLSPRTWTPLLA